MVFLNAVRLLLENFKNTYKIMLFQFITSLVACALCCAMVLPEVTMLLESAPATQFAEGVQNFFTSFFAFDPQRLTGARNDIVEAAKGFIDLLSHRAAPVVLATVGCVAVYLLKRYADTVCFYAIGSILNDKMATYTETPFLSALIANFKKANVYAIVYVLFSFINTILTVVLVFLTFTLKNILLSLFLSVIIIVLMQTLKLTGAGLWMPAMTADGKTLREAFHVGNTAERKQRIKMFVAYLESVYLIIIVNVVAAFCTFGSALILMVPTSFFLLICLQYVYYYMVQGKKYFISFDHIASNPDHGDREHIFNYIDETSLPVLADTAEQPTQHEEADKK